MPIDRIDDLTKRILALKTELEREKHEPAREHFEVEIARLTTELRQASALKIRRRPRTVVACPGCRSKRVVTIVYGEPDEGLVAEAANGRIVLSGAGGPDSPTTACLACGVRFGAPASR